MLQVRSCGGEVCGEVTFVEQRQAPKSSGQQFVAGNAERIHVVAHQSLKRIHAARAAGVEERQAGGSGQRETVAIGNDIGDVVGDQSIGAGQHLLFAAGVVEPHQAVGGGDVDGASLR